MNQSYVRRLVATAVLAGGSLIVPAYLHAGEALPASKAAPTAVDVALGGGGLLNGQVVDAQGAALKGAQVVVWHEGQQIAQTAADESGRFSVTGLRSGVHYVVAGQGYGVYRLWSAQTAPPSAKPAAMIVSGADVVRGQNGNMVGSIIRSPVLWGVLGYTAGHIIGFNDGIDRGGPSSP